MNSVDDINLSVTRRPMIGPDLPWTRRRVLGTSAAALLGGLFAGCGSSSDESEPSATDGGSTSSSAVSGTTFPRTVDHAAGSTVIEARPTRIVAVTDGGDLASLLALGIQPVGFGQRNDPLTPWIAEADGGNDAIQRYELANESNFEIVASWRPDIIIGQYGFVTETNIASYSAIAPTVATSFVGWRSSLRQTAAAVGEDVRCEEIIDELDAEIEAAAGRLAGATLRTRWMFGFPGYLGELNDRSPIGALLTEMGLVTLAPQTLQGEAANEIGAEQIGDALAEADALVVLDFEDPAGNGTEVLAQQALYASSAVVSSGRVLELGVDDSNAAYFDSVLTVRRNLALIERVIATLG